jgi:hypothetical protein
MSLNFETGVKVTRIPQIVIGLCGLHNRGLHGFFLPGFCGRLSPARSNMNNSRPIDKNYWYIE